MIPALLQTIAGLFAGLSENERRELLIHYAAGVARYAPQPGESFDVEDIRHDAECMDTVGVHVKVIGGRCHFRVSFGPVPLCHGIFPIFHGLSPLPQDETGSNDRDQEQSGGESCNGGVQVERIVSGS